MPLLPHVQRSVAASLTQLREGLLRLEETLARPEVIALVRDDASRESLRRLKDRVTRDLLPRLALGDERAPALVVGIAGPNNVGKSSLFNALAGSHVSPARAEGGLTKQCLAVCHPSMFDARLRSYLSQRYEVIEVPTGELAPVDQPGPPGRLFLVTSESMPRGLLVLDTPDFDSLYQGNRLNAEALLVTVDLVLFVVSRQTYQNAALVQFLSDAIGHGRPWAVLYNEATKLDVAKGHLDKLASDVGHAPVARFYSVHQPLVEEGKALLATEPLDRGVSLNALLSNESEVSALKARALQASLADAQREASRLKQAVREGATESERLASRVRHELRSLSSRAALKAVPADVLIEAFRDELDARSTTHRWIRRPFRGLATALAFVGRQVRKSFVTEPPPRPAQTLTEDALKDGLRRMAEALTPELAAWRGDDETKTLLESSLGPGLFEKLHGPLSIETPELQEQDRATLYSYSRKLISEELPGDGREEVMQALTTLVYSVPTGAAAAVTLATGGVGHDAVIWAGTLLSTPLLEKFVDLLGISVRSRVTTKWSEAHGESLAKVLETKLFSELLAHLDARVTAAKELASAFDSVAAVLHEERRA